MLTQIHIFSETRHAGEWHADTAVSFQADPANRFGWVKTSMNEVKCPHDYRLYGLLVDEVRCSWPWSMHERGFPQNASPEVAALNKSWGVDGYAHSFLTLQDLLEITNTLLKEARTDATELVQLMVLLIRSVSESNSMQVDPEDRRVVFWFDS